MKKILVFESNLAGRHVRGVALRAYNNHGAIYGQGNGLQGESYAIPIRDEDMKALPLTRINRYVEQFIKFATLNPTTHFEVTRVGCDAMAGYTDDDIAPMFIDAPNNCTLPAGWRAYANKANQKVS
jgi:hypothetical protein